MQLKMGLYAIYLYNQKFLQAFYSPPSYMLFAVVLIIGILKYINSYFNVPMSYICHRKHSPDGSTQKKVPGNLLLLCSVL